MKYLLSFVGLRNVYNNTWFIRQSQFPFLFVLHKVYLRIYLLRNQNLHYENCFWSYVFQSNYMLYSFLGKAFGIF
jgi:hypothetical protein